MYFKICLSLLLFVAIGRFCHKQTHGFQLYKILSTHHPKAAPPALTNEELEQIKETLSQPFYFLAHGGQCYAFLSADGQTVLKLFKQHHIRWWQWVRDLPLPLFLEGYRHSLLWKTRHHSPSFFDSCNIAYSEFRERTGLCYLHLSKTDVFSTPLTLIDPLGIAHQIDLDSTDFALQHRAEPLPSHFKRLLQENRLREACASIDSLLELIVDRFKKGIQDRDPNLRTNTGFVGTVAIELDLGSYSKEASPLSFQEDLLDKTHRFQRWLARKSPPLALYLSDRIEQILLENESL